MFASRASRCVQHHGGVLSPMARFSSASAPARISHNFTSTSMMPHAMNSSSLGRPPPLTQPQASAESRPGPTSARRRTAHPTFSTSANAAGAPDETDAPATPAQQTKSFLLSLGYSPAVSDGIIDALLQNGIPPSSLMGMVKGLAGRYEVGEDGGLEALATSVELELEKEHGKSRVRVVCVPSTGWSPAPDSSDDGGDTSDDAQQQQQQHQQQHEMPTIHSMDRAFSVEAVEGTTLTDVAQFGTSNNCGVLGEYLECACAGIMACSTCHVVVHPDWYDAAGVPADDEDAASSGGDSPNDPNGGGGGGAVGSVESRAKISPPSEAEQDMIDLAYEPQLTSRLGCQIQLTKELDGLVILLPRGSNNLMDFVPFE